MAKEVGTLARVYHSSKNYIFKYIFLSMRWYYIFLQSFFSIFQFFWIGFIFFIFCDAYQKYHHEQEYHYLWKILGNGLCIARGTASVMNFLVAVIMLPVSRVFNNILRNSLGKISIRYLTFYLEKIKIIHLLFSISLVTVAAVHGIAHIWNAHNYVKYYDKAHSDINWATNENDNVFRLIFLTPTGFTGSAMFGLLVFIWVCSTREIRDKFYNTFLASHHLFLLVFALMYFHPQGNVIKYQSNLNTNNTDCELKKIFNTSDYEKFCSEEPIFTAGHKNSWIWPTIAISIYLIDSTFRYMRRNFDEVTTVDNFALGNNGIMLRLRIENRVLTVKPGQYVLLQCPAISGLEWHPFTITECPSVQNNNTFTLTIAVRGDWTQKLYDRILWKFHDNLGVYSLISLSKNLLYQIDGPFPSPMESMLIERKIVCIAGGIGITPFISILNYLLRNESCNPQKIHLIWVTKSAEQFYWFSDVLAAVYDKFWRQNKPERLEIKLYVSQNFDQQQIDEIFKKQPLVKSRIHSGRPVWINIFNYLTFLYDREKISVYCCGPKTLTKEVKNNCRSYNKLGYKFQFIHEAFN